jgi:predicted RNA-binding Zn-ribbon protein involved in translation (DUF1610 family)
LAWSAARAILDAWDLGGAAGPARRPIVLLASLTGKNSEEALGLTVGACDAALLRAREDLLGTELSASATCPACGEELEFSLSSRELLRDAPGIAGPPPGEIACGHYAVRFRAPTCGDVIAACATGDQRATREGLLRSCVTVVAPNGALVDPAQLPSDSIALVEEGMVKADPCSELSVRLACPTCAHSWKELLDVASFFWGELQVLAQRLMEEVHVLAARYGWEESAILDMTAQRRQTYLRMGDA